MRKDRHNLMAFPGMCPSHFCWVRVTSPSSQSHPQSLRVESESSHDLAEPSQSRVTRTIESTRVFGLQTQVNVESNEISYFSVTFYAMEWHPTCYKMAPDKLENCAQCCFSKFDCKLFISSFSLCILLASFGLSHFSKSSVEFALHPQHETSRDSETQTKEDFKRKSRKRVRKFVNGFMD